MKNERRPESYWHIVIRQFRKNRVAVAGLILVLCFFIMALFADFIASDKPVAMSYGGRLYFPVLKDYAVQFGLSQWPREFQNISFKEFTAANFKEDDWAQFPPIRYSYNEPNLSEARLKPSRRHIFGTDEVGRDVASRLVHGSRISLSVGFLGVAMFALAGVLIGALAGYYGGMVDMLASRLIEIMLTIPTFFLIITLVAMLPPSLLNIVVVIAVTNWPTVARLTRGEFLRTKALDYVAAARAMGASDGRMIFRHILPNTLAPIFVAATFGVASAILIESTLSFLGFGLPPSAPSWGSILADGRQLLSAWWLTVFPGIAIFLTVTSYNLVGEGLRDAADPRLRG